jgi:WD40 repeat protein
MSSDDMDKDYEVELKVNKEVFKYDKVKKIPIILKGHIELPQDYKFTSPRLSKEGKYLTAIGKSKNEKDADIVHIWNARYLNRNSVLKLKGISKIEVVDFTPDEKTFVIVYKDKPPIFFDFDKGEEVSKCEDIKINYTKIISYSFSNKGKHFALATDKYFVVYNIKTGKRKRQIISDSPIKVYRGEKAAFIDANFNVKITDIKKGQILKEFQLTAMSETDGILSIMMSPDKNYIYYMKKDGVYKISIEKEEITQIKIEGSDISYGLISEDCTMCMTTDMTNSYFWDLEKAKPIGNIYKEKFSSFSVNFSQSKLITSDDICIDLTDIMNDRSEQKFIWLDLNPDKFMSFSFSPDYKVLLAKIDEHTAISYNCIKGNVIKKWKINLPNWIRACEMVPETSQFGVIATKSYNKVIKIWDYLTGTDLSTFTGFDVNNFAFNKEGNFLAAGTIEGKEIARIWDLRNGDEYSYIYDECKNNNKNAFVNISFSEPLRVICVAEEQNPVIFDLKEKQLIIECTGCPIQLSSICNLQSNEENKYFYIYGKDINNILTAILYDFSGGMINEYNNCRNIEFGKNDKYLLSDSDNINKGLLTISIIDEPNNIIERERIDNYEFSTTYRWISHW